VRTALVGSGPNDGNVDWTRRFFGKLRKADTLGRLWGWAMHHYAWNASGGRTTDWSTGKRDAVKFDAEQYYDILREADEMESLIAAHWTVMAESDPRHRTLPEPNRSPKRSSVNRTRCAMRCWPASRWILSTGTPTRSPWLPWPSW
jgi:hypothetical protein